MSGCNTASKYLASKYLESSNIILIGDFNLPAIDWSLNQQTPAANGGQLEESFCDLIEDNFLQQYISGSTHKDGNKLDLLLCNCPEIIKNVSSLPPDQLCFPTDHHIIEFGIQKSFCRAKSVTRTIFDYRRGNFDGLRSYLTRNPCGPISSNDINTCWSQWKEWFLHAVQKFIPIKKVKDKNSPPWIDGEVIYHIRKTYAALKKYRKTRTEYCKRKLRKISQTVKYLVKRNLSPITRNCSGVITKLFSTTGQVKMLLFHIITLWQKHPLRKLNFLTPISLQFSNLQLQRLMIPPTLEFLDYLLIYSSVILRLMSKKLLTA